MQVDVVEVALSNEEADVNDRDCVEGPPEQRPPLLRDGAGHFGVEVLDARGENPEAPRRCEEAGDDAEAADGHHDALQEEHCVEAVGDRVEAELEQEDQHRVHAEEDPDRPRGGGRGPPGVRQVKAQNFERRDDLTEIVSEWL